MTDRSTLIEWLSRADAMRKTRKGTTMKSILSMVIGVSLACCAIEASAEEPTFQKVQLDIARQSLNDALNAWAEQTGFQLVCLAPEVAVKFVAPNVKGALTAIGALEQLLEGTPLVYEVTSERTITVRARFTAASQTTGYLDRVDAPPLQIAALGAAKDGNSRIAQNDAGRSKDARTSESQNPSPENREVEELEEIVVTGTHIRGTSDVPMPTIVFTREDIDRTGYSTVEDIFKSLPQNLAGITPASGFGEGVSDLAMSNSDQATAIDLRGLGPQSTLVLLNGQRRAGSIQGQVVDVSAIPLSLIERVEVVTGGKSAIYGSDAVAGVVNIVTRRDFDGAESRVYYGESGAGAERLQLSQAFGHRSESGGFVVAYDYADNDRLDATEAGVVRAPSISDTTPTPHEFDLLPTNRRNSGFFSGRLNLGSRTQISADALYSAKDVTNIQSYSFPGFDYSAGSQASTDQYSIAPAIQVMLDGDWRVIVSGIKGSVHSRRDFVDSFSASESRSTAKLNSLSAVVDGTLQSSQHFELRTAIGGEARSESFESRTSVIDARRTITSAFAEGLVSLFPAGRSGQRIDVSLAGRFSDYDDVGSTFDPQVGVLWMPVDSINLRAAYSTAFRAPDLVSLNDSFGTQLLIINQSDPALGGADVPSAIWFGNNSLLKPEEATTWSVGLDYVLPFANHAKVSVSYFDIQYEDRIDVPAAGDEFFGALTNADRYPGLIDRNPSAQQLDTILTRALAQNGFNNITDVPFDPDAETVLDAFPNIVLFDDRIHNVASEDIRGIDVAFGGNIKTGVGTFVVGANASYYIDFERQVTRGSSAISQLNAPSKPADFRLRANLGLVRSALSAFVFLNYVDGYKDTFAAPVVDIASWTTLDATLRFDSSDVAPSGLLSGVTATLGIANVFDKNPPLFRNNFFGLAYDPVNADALGRFVSLSIVKKW